MNIIPTSYNYMVKGNLVSIVDCGSGKSVTDNIENVVEQICTREKIDPNVTDFIYRDTSGMWDAWDHKKQNFILLFCKNEDDAIKKLNQINIKP